MVDNADDPRLRHLNRNHRTSRGVDQLIGYCQGVLADGYISIEEAETLYAWLENNWDLRETWPANVLFARLEDALADGELGADEQRSLIETILDFTGGPLTEPEAASSVCTLPLQKPPPAIAFRRQSFVLTGVFAFGKRALVSQAIETRGGRIDDNVRMDTNFLVIGALGSADWRHATFGRKILAAVEKREKGAPISIVHESHWASCLESHAAT